jgi:hypothetical protein
MKLFVKNKNSFIVGIFFLITSQIVSAQNKEMDISRKNCDILDGTTANLAQSYSEEIGIPKKRCNCKEVFGLITKDVAYFIPHLKVLTHVYFLCF